MVNIPFKHVVFCRDTERSISIKVNFDGLLIRTHPSTAIAGVLIIPSTKHAEFKIIIKDTKELTQLPKEILIFILKANRKVDIEY